MKRSRVGLATVRSPERIYNLDAWFAGAGLGDAFALDGVRSTRVGLSAMYAHYDAGGTVCINVSESPRLKAFLTDLGAQLAGRRLSASFAKLYASGGDGSGFPLHWDQHPVFIVQLFGEKAWRYGATPSVLSPKSSGGISAEGVPVFAQDTEPLSPRALDGGQLRAPELSSLLRYTLEPQDCLYLPAGTWHQGGAVGQSIALSLSPVGESWF